MGARIEEVEEEEEEDEQGEGMDGRSLLDTRFHVSC